MVDGALNRSWVRPPASLGEVAALAAGDPDFVVSDWRVTRLSDRGIRNPDGLLLFSGEGGNAKNARNWSVVVKVIDNEDADLLPHDHLWYWKREALAFESGLLDDLPGGLSAPRCYRIETVDGAVWIWMEHVSDTAPPVWTTEEFVHAAYVAGRFGGAYLGARPLPDRVWLARDHARAWVGEGSPEEAWSNACVRRSFSTPLRRRVMRQWADRGRVFDWLSRLPQTFAHGDYHRRNLIIDQVPGASARIVAVDWAWCGIAPVGADLAMLLGMSATLGDIELPVLRGLERPALDAYLAGLRDAGSSCDSELVGLGYTAWLTMYAGITAPALTAFWTSDPWRDGCERQFGPPEQAAEGWAALCEFALDRGDEAHGLGKRLFPAVAAEQSSADA